MMVTSATVDVGRRRITSRELAELLRVDLSPSQVVGIDPRALSAMAERVREIQGILEATPFAWDDPKYWLVSAPVAERSQYFAIGAALDFRFWHLQRGRIMPVKGQVQGELQQGAMYMWRCLRRAVDTGELPVLDAGFLARITPDEFDAIFRDDDQRQPLRIAIRDRIANLRDLGAVLQDCWHGQFWNVVRESDGSLQRFARLSARFRAFDDPLYKLSMLNAILHEGSGLSRFDSDAMPAIDYHLVKQMLRHGILVPAQALLDKLVGHRYLTSSEASELRRMTLSAFLRLSDTTGIPGPVLDNLWWQNRRNCTNELPVCSETATSEKCPLLHACQRLTDRGMPLEKTRHY
jgi:hypothetical protein